MTERSQSASDEEHGFRDIFAAVQRGDLAAQEVAARRVLPRVVVSVLCRFRGERIVDPEDAALSAFRTILRRGWEFRRDEERIEPTSWDELAGLCVRFAYNKARTALKKQQRSKELRQGGADDEEPIVRLADKGQPRPEDWAAHDEMLKNVRDAVEDLHTALDEKEREILRGKFDGQTSRQIQQQLAARELFLTQSGVDKRWKRNIVPKLQERLGYGGLG